jgi:dipeptidase D
MTAQTTANNLAQVRGLRPDPLWKHFAAFSSVPRPSFKEDQIKRYVKDFARDHSLQWSEDDAGNMVIRHPGTATTKTTKTTKTPGDDKGPVILQGHVDMVTEKSPESSHDFETDPLTLVYDEATGWLSADGTTLGSDNGVGVCAALSVLERACAGDIVVPPLEVLLTVAEEVGLVGAFNLNVEQLGLRGTRLLNLDTEDWPDIFVGCAGGGDSLLEKRASFIDDSGEGYKTYCLRISGLPGGHSGLDIHRDRGNAVKIAAEMAIQLLTLEDGVGEAVRFVSIDGGDKRNALARDATMYIRVPDVLDMDGAVALLKDGLDPSAKVSVALTRDEGRPGMYMDRQDALALLTLIVSLPHGPLKREIDGESVQTSSNVASVKSLDDVLRVQCSTRSSIDAALERVRRSIRLIGEQCGFEVTQGPAYPGWRRDTGESELERIAVQVIRNGPGGAEPQVRTIHAGLECGVLKKKLEDALGVPVDALSIGPTITGAHSPDEKCNVKSTEEFYAALEEMLGVIRTQTSP